LVRAATPDAVLAAVEVLADVSGAGVLVVDVGGATTDVYSALVPDAEAQSGPRRDVAGTLWRARTVEGDLGVGVGAPGVAAAAVAERLADPADPVLAAVAGRPTRPTDPAGGDTAGRGGRHDVAVDRRLATLAATVALRRHARGHAAGPGAPRTGGRDLRDVRLVVGSGGVLRHGGGGQVLDAVLGDTAGGWAVPVAADPVVDVEYVLAAAGLLAAEHRDVAERLLRRYVVGR
jgi:uncharacterized protein (TIGR01319 family)